jgi:hypothetical protein
MNTLPKIILFWVLLFGTFGIFAEYCISRNIPLLITGPMSFIYAWSFVLLLQYTVKNFNNNKNKNKQQ